MYTWASLHLLMLWLKLYEWSMKLIGVCLLLEFEWKDLYILNERFIVEEIHSWGKDYLEEREEKRQKKKEKEKEKRKK